MFPCKAYILRKSCMCLCFTPVLSLLYFDAAKVWCGRMLLFLFVLLFEVVAVTLL